MEKNDLILFSYRKSIYYCCLLEHVFTLTHGLLIELNGTFNRNYIVYTELWNIIGDTRQ